MFVYVVRGYHKLSMISYIVGVYDSEEKAQITVDNCHDADVNAIYGFSYELFCVK